jgi:hypothetical protein
MTTDTIKRRCDHKDHEVAQFVNNLRDIAIAFKDAQCLRDVISREVFEFLYAETVHPYVPW